MSVKGELRSDAAPARLSPRERILAVAPEVLRNTGIIRFGLVEVAKRAGVSRQTIYNHFASRDELLGALLVEEMLEQHLPLQKELGNLPPSADSLVRLLLTEIELGRNYPLFEDMLEPSHAPRMAEIVFNSAAVIAAREAAWIPILERYAECGLLREGLPLPEMVRWITYQMFWFITHPDTLCPSDEASMARTIRNFMLPTLIVDAG